MARIEQTKDDELFEAMRSRLSWRLKIHEMVHAGGDVPVCCFGVDGNGGMIRPSVSLFSGVGSVCGVDGHSGNVILQPSSESQRPREVGDDGSELLPLLRLLDKKAELTVKDTFGTTPLQHATQKGHPEVVRLLLEEELTHFTCCA